MPDLAPIFGLSFGLSFFVIICTALPFIAVAGYLIYRARGAGKKADASQYWDEVIGTVVSSSIQSRRSSNSQGGTNTFYYPAVVYQYTVANNQYLGTTVAFGGELGHGLTSAAQAVVDRYIPGNQIRVYYNPDKPSEAVLERAVPSNRTLTWVAAFILIIVCITTVPILLVMGGVFGMLRAFLP